MRALLSVYDKTGIIELARGLHELGWDLVSSGGTARSIREAGIPVAETAEVTGFPAILGHRVVTLHPKIHGGILADRTNPHHVTEMADYGIEPFDLVVGNLYPFGSDPDAFEHGGGTPEDIIDIGGPAMVRAAAKNHAQVGVLTDPSEYDAILEELRASADGTLSAATRRRLARAAFAHTAAYDAAVVAWFDESDDPVLPPTLHVTASREERTLRYGENPHQRAALYRTDGASPWWATATQYGGIALSYLNLYDADAAWLLAHDIGAASGDRPAVAIIKHANPCGAAVADDITTAYVRAHECDPTSAFGGIVAVNRVVPVELATALAPVFTEVIVAPGYDDEALMVLLEKRNLRVLTAPAPTVPSLDVRSVDGGLLVQTKDEVVIDRSGWQVVTDRQPTESEWSDLELAWRLVARVTSNTIVLVKDGQAVGIGAGQQSRVDAAQIAGKKADGRADGGAGASDAFFPFRDGLDAVADQGVTAVIQPGGSIRDEEVIAAANERGLAMVMTGHRHFKH